MSGRDLPEEIYLDILSRLPVKSVLKCKCVSTSWLALISDPNFIKKHFDFSVQNKPISSLFLDHDIYSVGYDSLDSSLRKEESGYDVEVLDYPLKSSYFLFDLIGSCNGLVCLRYYVPEGNIKYIKFYCIWNPATREFKKIPPDPDNDTTCNFGKTYAFGYDNQNQVYKLLILSGDRDRTSVYTLGLDRWKSIRHSPYSWLPRACFAWNRVLCNGILHWLVLYDNFAMVFLNMSTEKFEEMQLPTGIKEKMKNYYANITHGVLEGCLCVLVEDEEVGVDVWVMQDYGVVSSWAKRYTIDKKIMSSTDIIGDFKIMGNFKNGQILLITHRKMVLYDPNNGGVFVRKFNVPGVRSVENYLESLVSLGSGTYTGRGQLEESTEA